MTSRVTESVQSSTTTLCAGELIFFFHCADSLENTGWFLATMHLRSATSDLSLCPKLVSFLPPESNGTNSQKNLRSAPTSFCLPSTLNKHIHLFSWICISAWNRISGWQQYLLGSHIDLIYLGICTVNYFLPNLAFLSSSFMKSDQMLKSTGQTRSIKSTVLSVLVWSIIFSAPHFTSYWVST